MRNILIAFLLLCPLPLGAQVVEADPALFSGENDYVPDALNRLYIVGLQYLTDGDLTQAEIAFRSIVAFPATSRGWRVIRFYKGKAHYYLGDIYFIQKRYGMASTNYQAVASEFTDIEEYTPSIFKLGRSLILEGRHRDGIEILKNYYVNYGGKDSLADNALFWIARGYLNAGEYLPALKFLEQILAEYPSSALAYDVRILAAQIKTDQYPARSAAADKAQDKAISLEAKREMVVRMDNLLQLKERLLSLQERKMDLLEQVSRRRAEAVESRQRYASPDSPLFPAP